MRCVRCGFQNPEGFDFCGRCGSPLQAADTRLTKADLDHLRAYLPPSLVDTLRQDWLAPAPQLLEQCILSLVKLLDMTSTFLPHHLIRRASVDPAHATVGGEFLEGALFLVDISELVSVASRPDRLGQGHGEAAAASACLDRLLSILSEHRGWLVEFSRNALLCYVDDATRGARVALQMQAATAEASARAAENEAQFQIKIGLHAGRFFLARLGTAQRMLQVLLGADANETAAIAAVAMPGQVLLDGETLQSISVPCQAEPCAYSRRHWVLQGIETGGPDIGGAGHVPLFPPFEPTLTGLRRAITMLDVLSPYLPAGLLTRLLNAKGVGDLDGAHRLVAALSASVSGLETIVDRLGTGREQEIVTILNRYIVAMQEAIYRYGGTIDELSLAVQGERLVVLFGTPAAHEDDADRAVRAALDMQMEVSEISRALPTGGEIPRSGIEQRIGVSFGYVLVGRVGASRRQKYTATGGQLILAERLSGMGDAGEVIVSEAVQRQVRDFCQLIPRGEISLKDREQPVTAHSVIAYNAYAGSLRGLQDLRSPLVGRQSEWDELLRAYDRFMSGEGQIVSIIGEAGLGKSRMLQELRDQVVRTSVWWLHSRCVSYTESVSYWPFQEMVRQMIGMRIEDRGDAGWRKLRETLEETAGLSDIGVVLPYLAAFLGQPVERWQQERLRHLDAQALQRRTFIAISILIESMARVRAEPLVLVLEDIHWIDQASTSLLEYLLPLVERIPLMVILVYRPEQERRCWEIHQRVKTDYAHCTTPVWLRPLELADSQALLDNLVPLERWPDEIRRQILERAEGNPFYLEEILRSLIDRQILIQDANGRWQVGQEIEDQGVPDTLQGVIMGRLDRLGESTRWAVQVASVIGRTFSLELLAGVLDIDAEQLNVDLALLQQHRVIYPSERVAHQVYAFRHVMVQEACYLSLTVGMRRLYHRRIAAQLARRHDEQGGDLEGSYPFIAYHAFAGQDWSLAFKYHFLAGQNAQRLFANELAIEHFGRVLHSAEHLAEAETAERRLEANVSLGELLTTTGQYDRASSHLMQAMALASDQEDSATLARACRWLARLHELRSEYMTAVEWIQEGLVALDGAETVEMTQLLLIAGLINTRLGNYDSASTQCEICLRVAEELGEVAVLARSYTLLGHLNRLQGNSAMAVWYFQRGLDLYEIVGDINGQAIAHDLIATALFHMGRWQEAERQYRQAREMCALIGNKYSMALADNNLGGIALNQGRLDEALTLYRRALRSLEKISESLYVQGALHVNLGHTFIRRGELEQAQEHLQIAERYFEQTQARDWLPEMYRHLAEVALLLGDVEKASVQATRALDTARELSMRNEEGNSLRVLADVALAQDRVDRAARLLEESVSILHEAQDEYEWARSVLAQAELMLARGAKASCVEMLERVESVFDRLGACLEMAKVDALRKRLKMPPDAWQSWGNG
jgi:class 3 adenylate cyclase/tetratricopeptide (TPR) repeat protein